MYKTSQHFGLTLSADFGTSVVSILLEKAGKETKMDKDDEDDKVIVGCPCSCEPLRRCWIALALLPLAPS